MCWLPETISLNVSATLPASPTHVPGSRTVKSPSHIDCRLARITVRSRDSSDTLGFPLLFARLGGRFSVPLCADSLSEDRFMTSPEKRAIRSEEHTSELQS